MRMRIAAGLMKHQGICHYMGWIRLSSREPMQVQARERQLLHLRLHLQHLHQQLQLRHVQALRQPQSQSLRRQHLQLHPHCCLPLLAV